MVRGDCSVSATARRAERGGRPGFFCCLPTPRTSDQLQLVRGLSWLSNLRPRVRPSRAGNRLAYVGELYRASGHATRGRTAPPPMDDKAHGGWFRGGSHLLGKLDIKFCLVGPAVLH